jgi:aerobic-type carbon monoxide dehydrogenase small subunit (CoxS/CutS family)
VTATPLWHRLVPRAGAAVRFTIDGAPAEVITAILTQRPNLRRFEFGDGMRAGFCLMGACQDCWVGLADGSRVRACTTLVEDGMAVVVESRDG